MTTWPTLALLVFGVAIGPHGLNLLSPSALPFLDPVATMALAALGVSIGLRFDYRRPNEGGRLAAAGVKSAVTTLIVGAAVFAASRTSLDIGSPMWLFALLMGVSAAAAGSAAIDGTNLEDLLVIVTAGLLAVLLRETSPDRFVLLAMAMSSIAVAIAVAGWLLVGRTSSEREQRVFVVGSLLLIGGAAAYMSLSALFAGVLAGAVWNGAGNLARDRIVRELEYLQHPLIALLLLFAAARATLSLQALSLAIIYLACRMAAGPLGRWLEGRLFAGRASRGVPISLVSAGVAGIGVALDIFQIAERPDWAADLLASVVIGSLILEVISIFAPWREAIRAEPIGVRAQARND